MKKLFTILFATMLAGQVCAQATFEVGNLKYTVTDETNHYVSVEKGSTAPTGDLVIPSEVIYPETDGVTYSVTSIGRYAFQKCGGLTTVTIPSSVTSIDYMAFSGCRGLAEVTISEGVTSIVNSAFSGCSGLTEVIIPNSITCIGPDAFNGCSGLTKITLPFVGDKLHSATDTYQYPFGYIFGTSSYTGGTSTTQHYYGSSTSSNTSSNYYIPTSLKEVVITGSSYIPYGAFDNCSKLKSVSIPESVTSIGPLAFARCTGLTKAEFASIESLCSISFSGSENPLFYAHHLYINGEEITELEIPNTITSIGSSAFSGCSKLTSITIPESVTSIGNSAFSGCSGLTSITIPNSVTSIGSSAFSGCSGLSSVTIPNSVTEIGGGVFRSCSGLTSITIPNNVTSIGSSAFEDCSGLTSVTIPNSVTSIGAYAFHNCLGLTSVTIPNSVTQIGENAFYYCSGLTSVNIGNSVTSIDEYTFSGCSKLTSITIPESVTSIGNSAFYGCSCLTSVTIPTSVIAIGTTAFNNENISIYSEASSRPSGWYKKNNYSDNAEDWNSGIGTVYWNTSYVKDGIRYRRIDDNNVSVVGYVGNISEAIIPEKISFCDTEYSVNSVRSQAFSGCSELTSVVIESNADFGNASLYFTKDGIKYQVKNKDSVSVVANSYSGEFVIPETVTAGNTFTVYSLGRAFEYCGGLTSITIPNTVTEIANNAFYNCNNLTSVTIPNSIINIGSWAFSGCNSLTSVTTDCEIIGNANLYFTKDGIRYQVKNKDSVLVVENSYSGEIVIPETVTAGNTFTVYSIGTAFNNCSSLTAITIPNTVTEIENNAFYNCNSLATVTIPNSVTSIGSWAFSGCNNLDYTAYGNAFYIGNEENPYMVLVEARNKKIETCDINSQCRFINDNAFTDCNSLSEISIPESVMEIGVGAFNGCAGLQKTEYASIEQLCGIKFADNLSNPLSLTHQLYIDGEEVTTVVIPETVESIGDFAFCGCGNIWSVTIGESVETIGQSAFYDCSGLTSISIPASVKSIGGSAFGFGGSYGYYYDNNGSLQYGYFSNSHLLKAEFASIESLCNISFGNNTANPLYYAQNLYINGEKIINLVIPETVNAIGDYALNGCTSIASLTISDSVKSIGNSAFNGCNRLASIDIPNSVTSIGYYAFNDCSYLKSLSYNSNAIGSHFNNISALESIFIGDSIKAISGYEFNGCDNLVNVISMAAIPPTLNGDPYTYADIVYVSAASVEAYQKAPVWKRKEILPLDYYSISVSASNAEQGTVGGSGNFAAKQAVTIYAMPVENYHFKAWSDGNTENPRTMLANSNMQLTAIFEGDELAVNVAAASDFGSVTGAESYHYGDIVTLTATPVTGYHFVGWSDGNTENPRIVIIGDDAEYLAVFEKNEEQGGNEGGNENQGGNNEGNENQGGNGGGNENQGGNNEGNENQGGENTNPSTAVAETAANVVNIYAHGNTIIVENATDEIRVYNAMGALVCRDVACRVRAELQVNGAGVYIVKVGSVAKRVMIND